MVGGRGSKARPSTDECLGSRFMEKGGGPTRRSVNVVVRSHEGSNDARGGWRGSVAGGGGILPASSDMEKAEGPRRPHAAREDGSSRRRSRVTGQEGGVLRREGLEMVSERSGDLGRRLTCKNASCAYQELRWRERVVERLVLSTAGERHVGPHEDLRGRCCGRMQCE